MKIDKSYKSMKVKYHNVIMLCSWMVQIICVLNIDCWDLNNFSKQVNNWEEENYFTIENNSSKHDSSYEIVMIPRLSI